MTSPANAKTREECGSPDGQRAAHFGEHRALEPRNAFEAKLIALNLDCADIFTLDHIRIGLETRGADGGEITLSLVAQDMRDFCLLDFVGTHVLARFAKVLIDRLAAHRATRMRIGPLAAKTAKALKEMLQAQTSNFLFEDCVLSLEPLLDKGRADGASKQSLNRALRKALQAGLSLSAECLSPLTMQSLYEQRWGKNRSLGFFEMMHAFASEPYCECISLKDASGRIAGQQLDFCFADQRFFYLAVADRSSHQGLGTALLAESIRRFYEAPEMKLYSFGRGGEEYKYRYAQSVRLNHYVMGFRANGRDLHA
jgi:hypothetical protein